MMQASADRRLIFDKRTTAAQKKILALCMQRDKRRKAILREKNDDPRNVCKDRRPIVGFS
jgi:hypothetical protein